MKSRTSLAWLAALLVISSLSSFVQTQMLVNVDPEAPTNEQLGEVQKDEFGIEGLLDSTQVEMLHKFYFFEFKDVRQFTDLVFDGKENNDTPKEKSRSRVPWFIFFYASWCPHCKKFAPTWKTYANAVGRLDKDRIKLAAVHCADKQSKPICDLAKITEYPSLVVFEGDMAYRYSEGMNMEKYEDFSTFEGYKSRKPEKINRTPDLPAEEKYPAFAELIRLYKTFTTTLPFGNAILPVSTGIFVGLVIFAIFGALVFAVDFVRIILYLLFGSKKSHISDSKETTKTPQPTSEPANSKPTASQAKPATTKPDQPSKEIPTKSKPQQGSTTESQKTTKAKKAK